MVEKEGYNIVLLHLAIRKESIPTKIYVIGFKEKNKIMRIIFI
jgi:hypothetical protein